MFRQWQQKMDKGNINDDARILHVWRLEAKRAGAKKNQASEPARFLLLFSLRVCVFLEREVPFVL